MHHFQSLNNAEIDPKTNLVEVLFVLELVDLLHSHSWQTPLLNKVLEYLNLH